MKLKGLWSKVWKLYTLELSPKTNNMNLVSKQYPIIIHGTRKIDKFEFNKDVGMYVCKTGHMATHKKIRKLLNEKE